MPAFTNSIEKWWNFNPFIRDGDYVAIRIIKTINSIINVSSKMFTRLRNIIRFVLFGAIGFGIGGIVLGAIYTTDNDWLWLLGLAIFGACEGAVLGLILGGWRKSINWAIIGALVFAVVKLILNTSQLEPILQTAIIGAIIGAFIGTAFGLHRTIEEKPADTSLPCEECGSKVKENDKYCPKCGVEFEEEVNTRASED